MVNLLKGDSMQSHPVTFEIDYAGQSDRVTVFFRIFLAIPVLIILALLSTPGYETKTGSQEYEYFHSLGIVFLPVLLMILFRHKYPKWWYDWNVALVKFSMRVSAYVLFLRDEYPSTDEEQAVHLAIPYPDVKNDLNRWLPLVKWLLVIPHIIVLVFLFVGVIFCTVLNWFIILFTGRYPKGIFDFVVGTLRWTLRVCAYAVLLTTDAYPPFSLDA